jgi:hypothetical protein
LADVETLSTVAFAKDFATFMSLHEEDANENQDGRNQSFPQKEDLEEPLLGENLLKVIKEAGSEAAMEFYAEAHEDGYKGAAEDVARLVENTLLSERQAPGKSAEMIVSKVFEATVLGAMNEEDAARSLSEVSRADLIGAIQHMLNEYVAKGNVKGLLEALKEQGNFVPVKGIKEVLHERLKHEESEGDYIVTLRSWGVESFLVKEKDANSAQEAAQIAENGQAYTYGLWAYHKRPEETYVVEVVGGDVHSVDPNKIEPQKTK